MTDNEIIKALKLCTSEHMGCEDGCPYATKKLTYSQCKLELSKNIIDLINRQKAEISELTAEVEKKQSAYELCKQEYDSMFNANRNLLAEIERLREQIKKGDNIYEDHMLKMEAEKDNLKQVIERLTEEVHKGHIAFRKRGDFYCKEIKTAKTEAYRELGDKLKSRSHRFKTADKIFVDCVPIDYIDNTLKELTDQTATNHSVSLIDGHIEG